MKRMKRKLLAIAIASITLPAWAALPAKPTLGYGNDKYALVQVPEPTPEPEPTPDDGTSGGGSAGGSCATPTDPNASKYPAWSASKVYNGGETVSYQNLVWKAKYWTQNNAPGFDADQWQLVSQVKMSWRPDVVYNGGDTTDYAGFQWKAKWWTKGDEPGKADVWVKGGASDCK